MLPARKKYKYIHAGLPRAFAWVRKLPDTEGVGENNGQRDDANDSRGFDNTFPSICRRDTQPLREGPLHLDCYLCHLAVSWSTKTNCTLGFQKSPKPNQRGSSLCPGGSAPSKPGQGATHRTPDSLQSPRHDSGATKSRRSHFTWQPICFCGPAASGFGSLTLCFHWGDCVCVDVNCTNGFVTLCAFATCPGGTKERDCFSAREKCL